MQQEVLSLFQAKQDEIATKITDEMDRGVTVLKGYGISQNLIDKFFIVLSARNEIVRLKNIITFGRSSPPLFHLTEVHDVMGEGFHA